jgi:hypothetical protein
MLGFGSYRTAWFMAHRIREGMAPLKGETGPLGGEGKIVEADTTWVGGKEKNKHRNKRERSNTYGKGKKQAVHTLVERGGHARSDHVANPRSQHCRKNRSNERLGVRKFPSKKASGGCRSCFKHLWRDFHGFIFLSHKVAYNHCG